LDPSVTKQYFFKGYNSSSLGLIRVPRNSTYENVKFYVNGIQGGFGHGTSATTYNYRPNHSCGVIDALMVLE
jgi:hypothetical protein